MTPHADPELLRAVGHALAGDWQAAHRIVQDREGEATADWIHGVVHRLEGDLANARYWYGQAGRAMPASGSIEDELEAIRAEIEARAGTRA